KPAATTGHTSGGRPTTSGPLSEDLVTYGSGKSFTVILRDVPGFSKRKSVNGGVGSPSFNLESELPTSLAGCAPGFGRTLVTYLTSRQRSFSGRAAHAGMPLSGLPCVINQKISPEATPFSLPPTNDGMFPVPSPVLPWHETQFRA